MDRDHRHDDRGNRQPEGEDDEGGPVTGALLSRGRLRRIRGPDRRHVLFLARNAEQVERQHHGEVDRGVGETRAAPAEPLDEQRAERPAHRAGETAEQRQVGDRAARVLAIEAAQGGERRIIQPGSHAETDRQPGEDEHRKVRGRRLDQQADRQQDGAGGEHRAATEPLDEPPDAWRCQPRREQPQRKRADDPGRRPAGRAGDRAGEHGEQVVGRSPCEDLPDADRCDDDGAPMTRDGHAAAGLRASMVAEAT